MDATIGSLGDASPIASHSSSPRSVYLNHDRLGAIIGRNVGGCYECVRRACLNFEIISRFVAWPADALRVHLQRAFADGLGDRIGG